MLARAAPVRMCTQPAQLCPPIAVGPRGRNGGACIPQDMSDDACKHEQLLCVCSVGRQASLHMRLAALAGHKRRRMHSAWHKRLSSRSILQRLPGRRRGAI
mmetsp:Transcript_20306/g.56582  ORF Transcript_20306/g.56582 Transcript_20306/m.56582 type:complete len:101 (+) Transcript_20306:605-907(+)